MEATVYMLSASHPANAGRLMVEHKGIRPKIVNLDLIAGLHDFRLRAAGFKAGTVPAVKLDGRRVQGTREIARALDELIPERPLLPADPERRAAVEAAETWGHDVLQPVPRVVVRAALGVNPQLRRWFIASVGLPAMLAPASVPVLKRIARQSDATEQNARSKLAALSGHLDHVDGLIADGIIGTAERNAADFQIAPTLRFLFAMEDLRPMLEGRPAAELACQLLPDYVGPIPAGSIPAAWLPAA